MENIFWKGYSNEDRHSAIDKIKNIVSKYGDIVDFKLFSDLSLTLNIEIQEFKIDKLYEELKENIGIDRFEHLNSILERERRIFLNITLSKGSGNLIVEVPSVPG